MTVAVCLVSEKYDDQIHAIAKLESQSATASDLIGCNESYSQWNRRIRFYVIDMDDCKTDLCFSRHI